MTPGQRTKMDLALARFVDAMTAWNWSPRSITSYEQNIRCFFDWLGNETDVATLAEVTPETLAGYQMALVAMETKHGELLAVETQRHRLSALRAFFRDLAREGRLLRDPAASLTLPKQRRALPQALLTPEEALRLLDAIDTTTPLGLRDRAIVEVLYASGLRNAELRALTLADFDPAGQTLIVVAGKGGKGRIVPLGPAAAAAVTRYIERARPQLATDATVTSLFLTKHGHPLDKLVVINAVRRNLARAGIDKPVRPHRLRHACATHMLAGGADIRHIQMLLGHASLQTTQIYTRVEISDLKAVHRKFHPRERGRRG